MCGVNTSPFSPSDVSMKSGLGDRNNVEWLTGDREWDTWVSMKSGLGDRNNAAANQRGEHPAKMSQ